MLRHLVRPFGPDAKLRCEFKVVDVQLANPSIDTTQLVAISGRASDGWMEQHARWHCRWASSDDASLTLTSIRSSSFEQTSLRKGGGRLFSDCTSAVMRGDRSYDEQLRFGKDHWAARLVNHLNFGHLAHSGLAIGDAV